MARPKKASATLETVEQAEQALKALLIADVELEKYKGAADIARAAATSAYETQIDASRERAADLRLQLQNWYMGGLKELERDGKKSVQLLYGTVGRRLGNPSLKPLNRAWTWEAIGVQLREIYKGKFFRASEPEIDKDLVKAKLDDAKLAEVGLKVEQTETFYAEPDRSKLETL